MKTKETIDQVREFHDAFGVRNFDEPNISDPAINRLRIALIQEELEELADALFKHDRVGVLDALTDISYVVDGAYLQFGLAHLKSLSFNEVHRSNMSKLGADGKPIYNPETRKVLKGPNYSKPNLAELFGQQTKKENTMNDKHSITIEEKRQIEGGQIIRATVGFGGCVLITETQIHAGVFPKAQHETERVVARIPAEHRAAVAAFFKGEA